jgi:hypothetical protein
MKKVIIILILLTACTMSNKKYEWYAGGSAPSLYPTELFFGDFIFSDGERLYIPKSIPFQGQWGEAGGTHILNNNMFPAPAAIDIIWLSLAENQFYSLQAALPQEKIANLLAEINQKTKKPKYRKITVGMAPYGGLAVWLSGGGIRTEVAWLQAEPTEVAMEDFKPNTRFKTVDECVEFRFKSCEKAYENFQKNGLPDRMLYERYHQKFNYHITPKFENEEAVFERIELDYYNGEYNETNSGEHAENAMRAKPRKIIMNWSIGKANYEGYFWTDENKIIATFANFYDNDPQRETNLIIEIGKDNKQFKFFLQNDYSIMEIPLEELEMIVFRNEFECYRSPSYKRIEGGWRD